MHSGKGRVLELILLEGTRCAHISCSENLIPSPGQYLISSSGSDSILPVSIFYTDSAPQGFIATAPESWSPGEILHLQGPLGRGFSLPVSARRVALLAFDSFPVRLHGLVQPALLQGASVVLVSDWSVDNLPDEVEVQPLSALEDILKWGDFIAIDVGRENLQELMERMKKWNVPSVAIGAQLLIRTPIPCGGVADCGVCAVTVKSGWQMVCKDGPVFDLKDI